VVAVDHMQSSAPYSRQTNHTSTSRLNFYSHMVFPIPNQHGVKPLKAISMFITIHLYFPSGHAVVNCCKQLQHSACKSNISMSDSKLNGMQQ